MDNCIITWEDQTNRQEIARLFASKGEYVGCVTAEDLCNCVCSLVIII